MRKPKARKKWLTYQEISWSLLLVAILLCLLIMRDPEGRSFIYAVF